MVKGSHTLSFFQWMQKKDSVTRGMIAWLKGEGLIGFRGCCGRVGEIRVGYGCDTVWIQGWESLEWCYHWEYDAWMTTRCLAVTIECYLPWMDASFRGNYACSQYSWVLEKKCLFWPPAIPRRTHWPCQGTTAVICTSHSSFWGALGCTTLELVPKAFAQGLLQRQGMPWMDISVQKYQ